MARLLPVFAGFEDILVAIEHSRLPHATERIELKWCGGRSDDSAEISPLMDVKLCTGRNSSTCGSIILMPCAFGSKPPYLRSGLSQISRRQERCSRAMSTGRRAS